MAGAASRLAVKQLFPFRGIAGDHFAALSRAPVQTPDVADQLPDLIVGQFLESRHFRAADAGPNISEEICILISVRQVARSKRWTSITPSFAAVASLASLPVKSL